MSEKSNELAVMYIFFAVFSAICFGVWQNSIFAGIFLFLLLLFITTLEP